MYTELKILIPPGSTSGMRDIYATLQYLVDVQIPLGFRVCFGSGYTQFLHDRRNKMNDISNAISPITWNLLKGHDLNGELQLCHTQTTVPWPFTSLR